MMCVQKCSYMYMYAHKTYYFFAVLITTATFFAIIIQSHYIINVHSMHKVTNWAQACTTHQANLLYHHCSKQII